MLADIRAAFSFLDDSYQLGSPSRGAGAGPSTAWFPLVGLCIGALLVAIARLLALRPRAQRLS